MTTAMRISFTFETAPEALEIYQEGPYGPRSRVHSDRLVPNRDTPSPETLHRCEEMLIGQDEWFFDTLRDQRCWVKKKQTLWRWRTVVQDIRCEYCGGAVQVSFRVLLRKRRTFWAPPPSARDLRKMIKEWWYTEQIHLFGRCSGDCKREFEVTHTPESMEYGDQQRYVVPA